MYLRGKGMYKQKKREVVFDAQKCLDAEQFIKFTKKNTYTIKGRKLTKETNLNSNVI